MKSKMPFYSIDTSKIESPIGDGLINSILNSSIANCNVRPIVQAFQIPASGLGWSFGIHIIVDENGMDARRQRLIGGLISQQARGATSTIPEVSTRFYQDVEQPSMGMLVFHGKLQY